MAKKFKHDPLWAKAKTLCRLNMEDVRMAKELGMKPKSLLKNIPSPAQKWKQPVKYWIRELYQKRFGHRQQDIANPPFPASSKPSVTAQPEAVDLTDDDIPF